MNEGRIQQIGASENIYTKPANQMVATFLGSPPINILPATYTNIGFAVGINICPIYQLLKTNLKKE